MYSFYLYAYSTAALQKYLSLKTFNLRLIYKIVAFMLLRASVEFIISVQFWNENYSLAVLDQLIWQLCETPPGGRYGINYTQWQVIHNNLIFFLF